MEVVEVLMERLARREIVVRSMVIVEVIRGRALGVGMGVRLALGGVVLRRWFCGWALVNKEVLENGVGGIDTTLHGVGVHVIVD